MIWYLVSTIVSGILVGLIASNIMHDGNGSALRYAIIGIVGSALGSIICRAVGIYAYGWLFGFVVDIAGACLLIWLLEKAGYR